MQGLGTIFSRITKLGRFDREKDEFVFRAVITDVTKFLQGSAEHCMMGFQLLSQLTCEMNQISEADLSRSLTKHREADASRSLTEHRKIGSSFRDKQLFQIFQLSSTLLRTALENKGNLDFNHSAQHGLMT